MDRLEVGSRMLALAPAAWLVGVFFGGDEGYGLPLGIILVGTVLAGVGIPSERRFMAASGLLVAAFGMFLFFGFTFGGGLAPFAGLVFTLACIAGAFAVLAGVRMAQAVCFGALAFAGLLWILSDLGSLTWHGGNLLVLGGGASAAVGALRDR